MESVFIVRQFLYQNDQNFARLDCEAVFSTFDAAHKFMLEELCWEEEGKRSLEWFRNEIVEYPLNKHIQAGYLSKRVYLTTGELHVDYDKIDESKPTNLSLGAELTLGELVRIPPDYELPGSGFFGGGFGVIVDLPRSETNNDPESCHYDSYEFYYICEDGLLVCGYLDAADVAPLSEPLPEELSFLTVLSDHFTGKKLLSDEMLDWLNRSQPATPVYVKRTPVFDFSKGTILRTWLADGQGEGPRNSG